MSHLIRNESYLHVSSFLDGFSSDYDAFDTNPVDANFTMFNETNDEKDSFFSDLDQLIDRIKVCKDSPVLIHNPSSTNGCAHIQRVGFLYIYPVLLLLCLFGNTVNLLVFRVQYLSSARSINFLKLKAIANILFMLGLVFEFVRAVFETMKPIQSLEWFLVVSEPYRAFFVLITGAIATWCALIATLQIYLCVSRPWTFRQTKKSYLFDRRCLVIMFTLAIITQLPLLFIMDYNLSESWEVEINGNYVCTYITQFYEHHTANENLLGLLEPVYFWMHGILVIFLPNALLLILSILISFKYPSTLAAKNVSHRRKCIIRLTFTTALTHLVLELPSIIPPMTASTVSTENPPSDILRTNLCILTRVVNFTSIASTTVPFVMYMMYNTQFRAIAWLGLRTCWSRERLAFNFDSSSNINRSNIYYGTSETGDSRRSDSDKRRPTLVDQNTYLLVHDSRTSRLSSAENRRESLSDPVLYFRERVSGKKTGAESPQSVKFALTVVEMYENGSTNVSCATKDNSQAT